MYRLDLELVEDAVASKLINFLGHIDLPVNVWLEWVFEGLERRATGTHVVKHLKFSKGTERAIALTI